MRSGEILNDRYEIISRISIKGFRQKWLASDKASNGKVVLETLHDDLMNDENAIEGLRYELQVSQKLKGEVFQKCIDTFLYKDRLFLVWQHYDYEPLQFALESIANGMTSDSEKLSFIAKLCSGINQANYLDIVHGRINGANVLVDPQLRPKIINFSLTHSYENTDPDNNSILSAKNLVAPEVILGDKADALSDYYSVGIIAKILFIKEVNNAGIDLSTLRLLHLRPDIDPIITNVIDGLSSIDRGLREVAVSRLLDEDFLDTMRTPPNGIPIVKISRFKSRRLLKKLKEDNNNS